MSEVKRYYVGKYGLVEGESLGRLSVVLAADYDAAVEQVSQLEQLNVLGQETVTLGLSTSARLVAERDALQQRLTAADERMDVLEGLLRRVVESSVLSFERDAPEELESLEADICAALKPAEGGGDE